jgi:uncharacterized protein (UPF0332 family)
MEPRDFLTLAEKLVVAKNAGAVHFRTATGRAYYSAFHQVTKVLRELGFPPAESAEGHFQAVKLLQRSGDEKLEIAGGLLGDLYTLRRHADYELQRRDVEKSTSAKKAVEIALSIFEDLDSFVADQSRAAAVTACLKPLYKGITGKT